ncbi:PREDICTED: uncharacterized protein LOC104595065 isoform X1 [Nelumbo nucifera]|nr:PREDICTED: uncharacterized protein LOC104595065 isoform X1 [Nelumbo nucifera]
MASQVRVPSPRIKKQLSGQQRIEELEQEVSMLHKMLEHEEKVHQILESANNRHDCSTIHIPSFLPPKMKELLAELAMVENEIARLEGEISHLKRDLSREQEVSVEPRSKQGAQTTLSNNNRLSTSLPNYSMALPNNALFHERLALETKALHFISKAIKGDYTLNHFNTHEKMKTSTTMDQKENHNHEEVISQEVLMKRSGLLQKPSSPSLQPRHPISKPGEHYPDVSSGPPSKSLSNTDLSEESSQKWQPNKISESIMKCLIFIFVRLIRTSRAMELEKSSTVSRSNHSSLSLRSFRMESILSPKASLSSQKESKQQDPYGIFDNEDSIPRDIGPYKNLVRFAANSLDPRSISSSSSVPLLQKLRVLMKKLHDVDLRFLTDQQKLAFWINMYNACIMHGFLQYGVPSSPEKLLSLMNKATLNIGGNKINAQAIEHFILRQQSSYKLKDINWKVEKDDKEATVRSIYGLDSPEPNVTFALCCGTRSSPAVRIYTAQSVSTELEKSKVEYLQASLVVTTSRRLFIPELLLQNMLDFAGDVESLVEWICHQLPTSGSLRKSIVECLRFHNSGKVSDIVDKMPYDFEFQYLLSI